MLLSYLIENNAFEKFKAIKRKKVAKEMYEGKSRMTEATLRKCLYRLEPMKFIKIIREEKEFKIIITEKGIQAVQIKAQNEEE